MGAAQGSQGAPEESIILNFLKHIQVSIARLEQKYEDIQTKVTENSEMIFELNEIQATIIRLGIKHEAIERMIKGAPKPIQTSSRPQRSYLLMDLSPFSFLRYPYIHFHLSLHILIFMLS